MRTRLALAVGALAFAALATANSGGYRFGVSDQAFYEPAVVKAMNPALYPRDTPLIEAQAGLALSDEIQAVIAKTLGVELPPLFFWIYLVTLVGLFFAAVSFGRARGCPGRPWPPPRSCSRSVTASPRPAPTRSRAMPPA